ncbi:hypothetical protein SAV31267_021590 [Streptomyces avermitilis]|uniref:Uncharacterized protein n=1 Tax=Streptomyces avermitilis TaxID=33903 RepID=A0A4D4MLV2_STRAX|nr:hypothetical protein SAV31267_021590 [Streptomyces avermitilis]
MQRAARRGRLRRGCLGQRTDGAQVHGAAVASVRLVRSWLVDDGRRGRHRLRHLIAPGTLLAGHQEQVVVIGGGVGGVEVGVRARRGDARLLHHACVLRQSLARDLAGVGHAYPSPIGLVLLRQLARNGAPTAPQ